MLGGELCVQRENSHRGAVRQVRENVAQQLHGKRRQFGQGDPCWEGMSARGLALVAEASGDSHRAFEYLLDARTRCNRLADPYVWLDVHILDALCRLGITHEHPETRRWVDTMKSLASRAGMKELNARAMLHSAALGDAGHAGDAQAAALLAAEVENDGLHGLLGAGQNPALRFRNSRHRRIPTSTV